MFLCENVLPVCEELSVMRMYETRVYMNTGNETAHFIFGAAFTSCQSESSAPARRGRNDSGETSLNRGTGRAGYKN